MNLPPVAVVPWPDESIPSMVWRLQAETGCPAHVTGVKSYKKLYDDPDPAVVQRLAGVLGVDADVLGQHTLQGALGAAYDALSWRDHRFAQRLRCPGCRVQPVWSRLVFCTTCPTCGLLLTEDGTEHMPATRAAWELQESYLALARSGSLGSDLRMTLMWRLLSFHLCTGWPTARPSLPPMPVGTGLSQPRNLTWRDPDWIAQFATIAWPATESTRSFRAHVRDVVVRRLVGATLPEVGPTMDERERLHRDVRAQGLHEHHVPDHLLSDIASPFDGCHLEAIGYAASRAMRREVIYAHTGHRPTKEALIADRGPLRQAREIAAINRLFADDRVGLRILRMLAGRLAAAPTAQRVDYRARRQSLASMRQVPSHVTRRLSRPVRERQIASRVRANPLERDAAAWLWVEFGGGVLQHSPFSASVRTRLGAFDRLLTPEDRLVLLDYGHELVGVVATDVDLAHPQHAARHREEQADAG